MRQFLVNLTNQLIQRHHLCELWERKPKDFEAEVRNLLICSDVAVMKGPKLGEILESFSPKDLLLKKGELSFLLDYFNDPQAFQKELVSFFLARAIVNRLNPKVESETPYQKPGAMASHSSL